MAHIKYTQYPPEGDRTKVAGMPPRKEKRIRTPHDLGRSHPSAEAAGRKAPAPR